MVKSLVLRGALAGAVGGLLAFVFAWIFAEPLIQEAIDYEGARDEARLAVEGGAASEAHEMFSRAVQGGVGIGSGMVLFGLAVGCFFAVAYCLAYGRTGAVRPRQLALLVALAGFVTLYLVPFLKYPANPPAIGNDGTIGARAGLYFVMVVASVAAAVLAVWLGQRLKARFGTWNATLLAGLAFAVLVGAAMAALPSLDETPGPLLDAQGVIVFPGFDADLLAGFRLYSVIAQVILWGAIALVFAPLADRVFAKFGTSHEQMEPVA